MEPVPSVFSHQITSSQPIPAPSTSRSPSPSTSEAWTEPAPEKESSTGCFTHTVPVPWVFSHQAISSAVAPAPRTSLSPSPSISPANTDLAVWKLSSMLCSVHTEPVPSMFSHQAMLEPKTAAPSTSLSVSPSTSIAYTENAPSKSVLTVFFVQREPVPSVFSHQAISSASLAAPRTSLSPSPSISQEITDMAPRKSVSIVCFMNEMPEPSVFSHQAISLSTIAAPSTSMSPSSSKSQPFTDSAPWKLSEMEYLTEPGSTPAASRSNPLTSQHTSPEVKKLFPQSVTGPGTPEPPDQSFWTAVSAMETPAKHNKKITVSRPMMISPLNRESSILDIPWIIHAHMNKFYRKLT